MNTVNAIVAPPHRTQPLMRPLKPLPRLTLLPGADALDADADAMREALDWLQCGAPSRAVEVLTERLTTLKRAHGVL